MLKDDPEEDTEEAETGDSQWRMFRKIAVPVGAVKAADNKPKLSRESKMRFKDLHGAQPRGQTSSRTARPANGSA